MSYPGIKQEILDYFQQNAGRSIFLDELVKATDKRAEQVQGAVRYIVTTNKEDEYKITTEQAGQIWRYDPVAQQATLNGEHTDRFEEVGVNKHGDKIIRDSDGKLYVATEL